MTEQSPYIETSQNTSAKIAYLQGRVAGIDYQLANSFNGPELTDEQCKELLDEREGLRLQAFADSLTRSKSNPIPDIVEELAMYLKPSMRDELNTLIAGKTTSKQLAEQLATIRAVIDKDASFKFMHQLYAGNGGTGVENSADVSTGIEQLH
ncbi:MAG: hypothetical protein Q7T74_03340 [Candidatus Saccharibacteria bacterium]|nr:hypothetical protein [Candidatus Saccharibacteria bacterium]